MDVVSGLLNFNLIGHSPFIHHSGSENQSWLDCLNYLKAQYPLKRLDCATDAYITDPNQSILLGQLFEDSNKLLSNTRLYVSHVFHKNGNTCDNELDDLIPTPECLNDNIVKSFRIKRLVAGSKDTGTALHQHSRAYFHNISGLKRWFLARPTQRNNESLAAFSYDLKQRPIASISKWFYSHSDEFVDSLDDACVIDLKAGESLFIPDGFHHAVLNLSTSIGVAYSWEYQSQYIA